MEMINENTIRDTGLAIYRPAIGEDLEAKIDSINEAMLYETDIIPRLPNSTQHYPPRLMLLSSVEVQRQSSLAGLKVSDVMPEIIEEIPELLQPYKVKFVKLGNSILNSRNPHHVAIKPDFNGKPFEERKRIKELLGRLGTYDESAWLESLPDMVIFFSRQGLNRDAKNRLKRVIKSVLPIKATLLPITTTPELVP